MCLWNGNKLLEVKAVIVFALCDNINFCFYLECFKSFSWSQESDCLSSIYWSKALFCFVLKKQEVTSKMLI